MTLAAQSAAATARRWPIYREVVWLCFAAVFISYIDRTNISVAAIAMQEQFGWTQTTKGLVLSSFFIGYLLLQIVAGTISNRFGGRTVLGFAVVWWSLWTILTPPAAYISLGALVAARIALGLGEAAVFPASINMMGRWVPKEKRSSAVATFTSGLMLGTVFALPMTGWLVRAYGWPMPFYAFGAVGFVWTAYWFLRIPPGRDESIADSAHAKDSRSIPWGKLLTMPAVWAIIINHFANNWALYVMLAWLPSYFKATFGVSLANAGLLSAAPWLTSFIMANIAGATADRMLHAGKRATYVRKLMQTIGLVGSAVFLLLVQQAGSLPVAVVLLCGAAGTLAACLAGFTANSFDIAPRYADIIWGISNTFGTIPGIIGVAVTGWLVDKTGGFSAPFIATAVIGILGAVVFLIFGSGERQID